MEQQCEELRYMEVGTLLASDAEAYDYFGKSVAIDGNRLAVGAHGKDNMGVDAGKVYIYDWTGRAYVKVAQLTASDTPTSDIFGSSVALSGNRLVVGASIKDNVVEAGKVYIYDWDVATSTYIKVAQLTDNYARPHDNFGTVVAVSGNKLVVGAQFNDTTAKGGGVVHVYDWDISTSTYVEVAQLTASDAQTNDNIGSHVAISGNRFVAGEPCEDSSGVVSARDWNGATSVYDEAAKLVASKAEAYDIFGYSVALCGNRFVIGEPCEDSAVLDTGKVCAFDRQSGNI